MARSLNNAGGMRSFVFLTSLVLGCGTDSDEPAAIKCPEEAEVCGYRDAGWEASCTTGLVVMRSFNTMLFCAPGQSAVLCESEPPAPMVVHTCAAACGTHLVTYLETVDEYNAFDPATLCQ